MPTLARAGRFALDLLYPPRCVLCGRGGAFVCEGCVASLPRAGGTRCDRCWLPLVPGTRCRACAEFPLALSHLRAAFRYEDDVRKLVRAFKFGYQSCLAEPLARVLLDNVDTAVFDAELIVPVPLTGARKQQRGFNQAALLAREVSREIERPVVEALRRHGHGRHNAQATSRAERRRNVEGVFSVRDVRVIEGRRVLLMDDLTTTGATLDACAKALLAAGAIEVSAMTLARED